MAGLPRPESTDSSQANFPVPIRGWVAFAIVVVLAWGLLSLLWFVAERFFVTPYYEFKRLGPVPLGTVQAVQVQIEHPRLVSRHDRSVQHDKRIVISLTKTQSGPTIPVDLAIVSTTGPIRFLDRDGHDISGRVQLHASYGVIEVASLYLEHSNVSTAGRISMRLNVLPPTGGLIEPATVDNLEIAIKEESAQARTVRQIVSFVPWQTFLLTLLAPLGALVKQVWSRSARIPRLYEEMQQAWEEELVERVVDLYGEYQDTRIKVQLFKRSVVIPGHQKIEELYQRVREQQRQAREASRRAAIHRRQTEALLLLQQAETAREQGKAQEELERAVQDDPVYDSTLLKLDQRAIKQEARFQASHPMNDWWLSPQPTQEEITHVLALLQDQETVHPEIRRRIVRILGRTVNVDAKRGFYRALRQDDEPAVRAQAAWMLAQTLRPRETALRELQIAEPDTVKAWLNAFSSPLEYNPFQDVTATPDHLLSPHFVGHSAYFRMLHFGPWQAVALFAGPGEGKTVCRRMFRSSVESEGGLVVEHIEFSELLRHPDRLSVQDHAWCIYRSLANALGKPVGDLESFQRAWVQKMEHLLRRVGEDTGPVVYVLVDNVFGHARTQAQPQLAEQLLRDLVGNTTLLEMPQLCFRFFLPRALREHLLTYSGFTSGRIRELEMVWNDELLKAIIQQRLRAASPPPGSVDSLMPFTHGFGQVDLDQLLIREAQGNPRRLMALIQALFQHRAQSWHTSRAGDGAPVDSKPGADEPQNGELYITPADWAVVLEDSMQQPGKQRRPAPPIGS